MNSRSLLVRLGLKLCVLICAVFSLGLHAQTVIKPDSGVTYIVKQDYRKCAFPMCGGWFLTPVNQYSLTLQTEDEAYASAALLPNSIYVAYINYKRMGLTAKQIEELQAAIRAEQALLKGTVTATDSRSKTLVATNAWVGANKNTAVGPYLNVTSTGIVCITTPCPYFKANVINTGYSTEFHDLSFEKSGLDDNQILQAWTAISTGGLVLTGTRYASTGFDETGAPPRTGVGIAATKVFFAYPPAVKR